jgi:2-keto-4-pentenoate hydratase/2-oxohepta-3-ene-1,7-dioic acid hydratase in catechol pathway
MKLVTFELNGNERVGLLDRDRVIDLREAHTLSLISQGLSIGDAVQRSSQEIPACMISLIERGHQALEIARDSLHFITKNDGFGNAVHPLRDVKLKAPIPRPPMILNMGNAYRPLKISGFTFKPVTGVIGPDDPIVIPKEISDHGAVFEPEIGVIIGKKGRRIQNDNTAYDYVYGYTIYNDVTDYGRQMKNVFDMKIFDTFCPMGPCIVTKDELGDPHDLVKRVWVSGQFAGERSTKEMLRLVPEFVSVPSQTLTLLPGTVISTGAPFSGRIKPGDVVEIEITKIGRLRNSVTREK